MKINEVLIQVMRVTLGNMVREVTHMYYIKTLLNMSKIEKPVGTEQFSKAEEEEWLDSEG